MEREKIEELLRKFYDGLTSAEEEEMLRDLLDTPEATKEFECDREILFAGKTGIPEPSAGFMSNLREVTKQVDPATDSRRLSRYSLSLAAGIALVLGSYFMFRAVSGGEPADTFSDPELAMAEVRNILLDVSQNMNSGTEVLKTINTMSVVPGAISEMGRTARTVDRSLSGLRFLNDLNSGSKKNDNDKK